MMSAECFVSYCRCSKELYTLHLLYIIFTHVNFSTVLHAAQIKRRATSMNNITDLCRVKSLRPQM